MMVSVLHGGSLMLSRGWRRDCHNNHNTVCIHPSPLLSLHRINQRYARIVTRSHLSMSLLVKFPNVPEDGYTLSEYDRSCDVTEKFCKTPVHVWEIHCPECRAAGKVPVHRKRKNRILSVCPRCSGLGFVRYVSSDITEEDEEGYTMMRSPGDYYSD